MADSRRFSLVLCQSENHLMLPTLLRSYGCNMCGVYLVFLQTFDIMKIAIMCAIFSRLFSPLIWRAVLSRNYHRSTENDKKESEEVRQCNQVCGCWR